MSEDYAKGLRALRALSEGGESDHAKAGDALYSVLEICVDPETLDRELVEAVGRIVKDPDE